MKKLVIFGVGGFGREVAWLVERINQVQPTWQLAGFIDDNKSLNGTIVGGYPVLGCSDWLKENMDEYYVVCAIGSARTRRAIIKKLVGVKFATLIDPSVCISDRKVIGEGCIICAGSIGTVDITLGKHVIVNLDCTIGHDAIIEDFVTLYPSVNISGNTIIETCVEIGTGSVIIQGRKIGEGTIIGAGAIVVRDIPKNCTAVGSPAKAIKYHETFN